MVSRDVTQRRELEHQSQAALRELNQRMEAFLSIAGHEMRTPLTSLLGNIQLAARTLNDLDSMHETLPVALEQLKVLVYRMERQGRVLNSLVNNVLEASAVQSGRFDVQPRLFDVLGVIQEVVEDVRPHMRGRSIEVQIAVDGPLVVEGDPDSIAQVLGHFLANAHKFSPLDEPIQVGAAVLAESVRVCVADCGPGVPSMERERIWERFYRVEGLSHVSGSSVGLGLGLYLSRRIIERHGGTVGLDTPRAGGARFWFRLPLIGNNVPPTHPVLNGSSAKAQKFKPGMMAARKHIEEH
jgi:signal transduction histidine kinase